MSDYFIIASRDPFDCNDTARVQTLVTDMADAGHRVTLFLVQNGVLAARRGALWGGLTGLAGRRVLLLADRFSLAERALPEEELISAVRPADINCVIDALVEGQRVIWH